jgi:hypothetical protein
MTGPVMRCPKCPWEGGRMAQRIFTKQLSERLVSKVDDEPVSFEPLALKLWIEGRPLWDLSPVDHSAR